MTEISDPFYDPKKTEVKDGSAADAGETEKPKNDLEQDLDRFSVYVYKNIPPFVITAIEKLKSLHQETGVKIEEVAQVVDQFAVWEHFATAGIVLMTAVLSWFVTFFRLSFGWWFLGLWYLAFLYTKNISRLRYKVKNHALKEFLQGELDSDKEYVEWFNEFLGRFWLNFEPELSKGLKDSIGATLDTIKVPGLDEIVLSKFTLGSQAPRIDSIKTFTNTGEEKLILDFDLSFTPFDEESVSKKDKERLELRNLGIVLLAKIAMVPLPIALRELYINGTLRVQFKYMSAYPHIQTIDIGFIKKPEVDFILKPLGTDLSKIAGLGTFIKDTVDSQLAAMLVNPVKMTFPIGEWMSDSAGSTETPVGVLRVVIYEAKGVKNVDVTGVSDPAALVKIGGNEVCRTRVFDNSLDPKWSEVHHIIIYQSMLKNEGNNKNDEFQIEILHVNALTNINLGSTQSLSLRKWIGMMGITGPNQEEEMKLSDDAIEDLLYHWGSPFETNGHVWKNLSIDEKKFGSVRLDLSYYPVIPMDPNLPPIYAGVVTIIVQQAKEVKTGNLSVVGKIGQSEVVKTPVRKRTVNPSWGHSQQFYCGDITKTDVYFTIMNKNAAVGNCKVNLAQAVKTADDWYKILDGSGKIRITVKFQPLDVLHSTVNTKKIRKINPIGGFRIKVTEAKDLPVLMTEVTSLGKPDPYCKALLHGRALGVTSVQEGTISPVWNETFFTFAYSLKEKIILDVFDSNNLSKDRPLGKTEIQIDWLLNILGQHKNLPNFKADNEMSDVLAVKKDDGTVDVWAPLYYLDDMGSTSQLAAVESITRSATDLFKGKDSVAKRATKKKKKGSIHFEIQFYPIVPENMLDYETPGKPYATDDLASKSEAQESKDKASDVQNVDKVKPQTETEHAPVAVRKIPKDIVAEFRTGILRFKVNQATISKVCRPYIEIVTDDNNVYYRTFTSNDYSLSPQWFGSFDQFMIDLPSNRFKILLKDQGDHSKQSQKDQIIGFWVGDIVESFVGKGPITEGIRQYSENWSDFPSLPEVGKIDLACSYFPIEFPNMNINGDEGILHLDILRAANLPSVDSNGLSDPYILVSLNGKHSHKTKTQKKTLAPTWDEGVTINVHSRIRSTLYFEIMDFNQFSAHETLGIVSLSLANIAIEHVTTIELPIKGKSGELFLRYLFEPKALEKPKDTNASKMNTEVSSLQKFGKGLTSQITGIGSAMTSQLKKEKTKKAGLVESIKNLVTPEAEEGPVEPKGEETTEKLDNPLKGRLSNMKSPLASSMPIDSADTHSRASSVISVPPPGEAVEVIILGGKNLKPVDGSSADPYVRVTLQGSQHNNKKIHKTAVVKKSLNPQWTDEKFTVALKYAIKLSIMDKNVITQDVPMGHVILDLTNLLSDSDSVEGWYKIQNGEGLVRPRDEIRGICETFDEFGHAQAGQEVRNVMFARLSTIYLSCMQNIFFDFEWLLQPHCDSTEQPAVPLPSSPSLSSGRTAFQESDLSSIFGNFGTSLIDFPDYLDIGSSSGPCLSTLESTPETAKLSNPITPCSSQNSSSYQFKRALFDDSLPDTALILSRHVDWPHVKPSDPVQEINLPATKFQSVWEALVDDPQAKLLSLALICPKIFPKSYANEKRFLPCNPTLIYLGSGYYPASVTLDVDNDKISLKSAKNDKLKDVEIIFGTAQSSMAFENVYLSAANYRKTKEVRISATITMENENFTVSIASGSCKISSKTTRDIHPFSYFSYFALFTKHNAGTPAPVYLSMIRSELGTDRSKYGALQLLPYPLLCMALADFGIDLSQMPTQGFMLVMDDVLKSKVFALLSTLTPCGNVNSGDLVCLRFGDAITVPMIICKIVLQKGSKLYTKDEDTVPIHYNDKFCLQLLQSEMFLSTKKGQMCTDVTLTPQCAFSAVELDITCLEVLSLGSDLNINCDMIPSLLSISVFSNENRFILSFAEDSFKNCQNFLNWWIYFGKIPCLECKWMGSTCMATLPSSASLSLFMPSVEQDFTKVPVILVCLDGMISCTSINVYIAA